MTSGLQGMDPRPDTNGFNLAEGQPKSDFYIFSSAFRDVYPEEFDGDLSIRRSFDTVQTIERLLRLRTRFQTVGLVLVVTGLVSSVLQLGADWAGLLIAFDVALTAISLGAPSAGLASIGLAELSYMRQVRLHHRTLSTQLAGSLTHRTLYFGSAQYSVRFGEEGLCIHSNRISSSIFYWAIDEEVFRKRNGLPEFDILPFREASMAQVKSARQAQAGELQDFAKLIFEWFGKHQPTHLYLPLITEHNFLRREFAKPKDPGKGKKKPATGEQGRAVKLESETLIIPLSPFDTNRDSSINAINFVMCVYFGVCRAHLDMIKLKVLPRP